MEKKTKVLIGLLIIIILACAGVVAYKIYKDKIENKNFGQENTEVINNTVDEPLEVEVKTVQTFKGDERPIAVMIDNHKAALPQGGLNNAYMVYEIIVEGGESRLMALFKGQNLEKIGPVRSSRHYFLDYALENDAIYVHYGWSPQAQSDIASLGVNNINGIQESSSSFWRVKDKSAPHNLFTSTESILKIAERKGYSKISNKKSVLNYVSNEVEMPSTAVNATSVTIPHSNLQTVKYEYDGQSKTYKRYARNKLQTDYITGEPVTTKNIIITMCENYTLEDSENKGRQGLKNIGTFKGYYITDGKAIEIQCIKNARNEQTVYKDLNGKEIEVNDGNTFVNICPIDANLIIE